MTAPQVTPPEWHPETRQDYDSHLSQCCAAIASELRANPLSRADFFTDLRPTHARLYKALAPAGYEEYAGTYRGTQGTSLEHRRAGAPSFTGQIAPIAFTNPGDVASAMSTYLKLLGTLATATTKPRDDRLTLATVVFVFFGKIHPFLDGNGHNQRLLFLAAVLELGLDVAPAWTIHPRPYDIHLAKLLEAYHLSGNNLAEITMELSSFVL